MFALPRNIQQACLSYYAFINSVYWSCLNILKTEFGPDILNFWMVVNKSILFLLSLLLCHDSLNGYRYQYVFLRGTSWPSFKAKGEAPQLNNFEWLVHRWIRKFTTSCENDCRLPSAVIRVEHTRLPLSVKGCQSACSSIHHVWGIFPNWAIIALCRARKV